MKLFVMTPTDLYKLWAPEDSIWSNWVKPVLFADPGFGSSNPPLGVDWRSLNVSWSPSASEGAAIVLDLPGEDAVWLGTALSQRGFRPVQLFNGVRGPVSIIPPLVNVNGIVWALQAVSEALAELRLPPGAPPVFLLDANRMAGGASAGPGRFDNRWCVFPQDFPSANFLLSQGLRTVVLALTGMANSPRDDLAHVLLRWQQAGLRILSCAVEQETPPTLITVGRPHRFRALWYRALVIAGLRRNSAGGFGAVVPEPSSSGSFG